MTATVSPEHKARSLMSVLTVMAYSPLPFATVNGRFRITGGGRASKRPGRGGVKITAPSQEEAERFCREQDARRIAAYGPSDVEQFDREQDAEWALAHARYLLTKRRHAAKADPEGTRLGRRHRRQQRYLSAVALGKITPNDDHERQCFEPTPYVAPVGWCERKQKT